MYKKIVVFVLCLIPIGWFVYRGVNGDLGPDPGKVLVLESGLWALRLLLITLAISPIRWYLGYGKLITYRQMLGLYVWFYASIHFVAVWTYILDWKWTTFLKEFTERPYMAVGICAWLLLLPLGITSNRWSQRKLGRKWKRLHQSVYLIAVLACIHFLWLVRSDYEEVFLYSLLTAMLLGSRLVQRLRRK